MRFILFVNTFLLLGCSFLEAAQAAKSNHAIRMIVDTDIGPWPDDIGAFSILHSFADQGLVELLGIVSNNRYPGAVAVIDAMNTYFNRSNIPIGITQDATAWHKSGLLGWPEWMLQHFPHPHYLNNEQAEEAVHMYRRILSGEPDGSVTLLSIGYMTNLGNLLRSAADHYSPLTGRQLLQVKVKHMFAMAGWYPSGNETNLIDQPAASQFTLPHWPTPITLVGFEAGEQITCGLNLLDYPRTNRSIFGMSPVAKAFELYNKVVGEPDGCFDELAAYISVKGIQPLYELQKGSIVVFPNGNNSWLDSEHGPQAYVRQVVPKKVILDVLNPLLEQ